jgi:hypothetical protein
MLTIFSSSITMRYSSSTTRALLLGSSCLASLSQGFVIVNHPSSQQHARGVVSTPVMPTTTTTTTLLLLPNHHHQQQQQQSRHYSFLSDMFKAFSPEIASQQDIAEALKDPQSVLIDVRTEGEIQNSGKVVVPNRTWIHAPGTPFECAKLEQEAETLLPNKQGEKEYIVVLVGSRVV